MPIRMRVSRSRPLPSVPKRKRTRLHIGDHDRGIFPRRGVLRCAVVEQVGAVDIADDARIERLVVDDRRAAPWCHRPPPAPSRRAPARRALSKRGHDRVLARIGFEARRRAHILRIDPVIGMRARQRAEDAHQRHGSQARWRWQPRPCCAAAGAMRPARASGPPRFGRRLRGSTGPVGLTCAIFRPQS